MAWQRKKFSHVVLQLMREATDALKNRQTERAESLIREAVARDAKERPDPYAR